MLVSPTVLSAFVSLSVTRTLILPISFPSSAQTQHGRRRRTRDERKKEKNERNWSLENVAGFFFTQMFEFFSRRVDLEALLSTPAPPPCSPLLANHGTTLLYLGHGNMLPLSPMADALCCNLRKKKMVRRRGAWIRAHHRRRELSLVPPKKGKKMEAPPFVISSQSRVFSALPLPVASRRLPSPAFICLSE